MISESTIEKCIEEIAATDHDWFQLMAADQPIIAGYLSAEDHSAFTPEETQYLYYLAVLIWKCFDATYPSIDDLDEDDISMKEEQNWNRIDSLRPSSLKHIVDRWLQDYAEPELLYYLEDALILDEEDPDHPVTKVGQIPLFVTLLTMTDVLIGASHTN